MSAPVFVTLNCNLQQRKTQGLKLGWCLKFRNEILSVVAMLVAQFSVGMTKQVKSNQS